MSKRLGKGLDALIPSLSINEDDKVVEIPLAQLRANPYQPRKDFNEEAIQELAESIRQHGVIQPIIVRSVLKGYEITFMNADSGHRNIVVNLRFQQS